MKNKKQKNGEYSSPYEFEGRIPLKEAIPLGLQHVLAMFVANLAPVLIVCSAALVRGMVSSAGRCSDTYRVSGGKICVKGRL